MLVLEFMGTVLVGLAFLVVFFFFLWRAEAGDARYWKGRAHYYMNKWDEEVRQNNHYHNDDDPANWWRLGGKPYGDPT